VPTETAPLEKIFPASHNAKDVRDALERAARAAGVLILLSAPLAGLERSEDGFRLHLADGSGLWSPRVVLAVGGQSYPKTGTTGDGYAWLRALRLPLVEPVPALVPLHSPADWVRDLTGIALPEVEVRLCGPGGQTYERRRRPLLFTHQGLSGPGAMDLSARVARAARAGPVEGWSLMVDFLPDHSREALRERCIEAAGQAGNPRLDQLFGLDLPRRVEGLLAERCGLGGRTFRVASLDRARRHALVETLKGWPLPVDGTLDYDKAEVTAGGLALKAVDPATLRVHGIPGLYVIGELLDLQGPIGGLNFQAAFATAELAGLDAARPPA
jgi:predicted Rossmann fold flavoprotein